MARLKAPPPHMVNLRWLEDSSVLLIASIFVSAVVAVYLRSRFLLDELRLSLYEVTSSIKDAAKKKSCVHLKAKFISEMTALQIPAMREPNVYSDVMNLTSWTLRQKCIRRLLDTPNLNHEYECVTEQYHCVLRTNQIVNCVL